MQWPMSPLLRRLISNRNKISHRSVRAKRLLSKASHPQALRRYRARAPRARLPRKVFSQKSWAGSLRASPKRVNQTLCADPISRVTTVAAMSAKGETARDAVADKAAQIAPSVVSGQIAMNVVIELSAVSVQSVVIAPTNASAKSHAVNAVSAQSVVIAPSVLKGLKKTSVRIVSNGLSKSARLRRLKPSPY